MVQQTMLKLREAWFCFELNEACKGSQILFHFILFLTKGLQVSHAPVFLLECI